VPTSASEHPVRAPSSRHDGSIPAPSTSAAFTLVELLIVIGIIALLAGILLPTLSNARDSANTLRCLANLRMIVIACTSYSADHRTYIIPAQYHHLDKDNLDGEMAWPNILVEGGYLTAPDSTGQLAVTKSVFFCPSGRNDEPNNTDIIVDNGAVPANRLDDRASIAVRYQNRTNGIRGRSVDTWYGINADTESDDLSKGPPCRRMHVGKGDRALAKLGDQIRNAADLVYFYDGTYMHYETVNASRITARHSRKRKTNLVFFDGHAITFSTEALPGGLTPKPADFDIANLNARYPAPPNPMWLLDQQH
jgi:prepilin-type N-terminal cleavage/methylation domain-containing protein/prepilin-type processing-associated H-X9-DG protein